MSGSSGCEMHQDASWCLCYRQCCAMKAAGLVVSSMLLRCFLPSEEPPARLPTFWDPREHLNVPGERRWRWWHGSVRLGCVARVALAQPCHG
ncbi:hypothetical protein GQ55_2G084800 [Panicum hallii var. hallii]|uniref:Uncharacterized protein n=1 Tax=Panicum hallii var. hallii TaxID=1504633 RepID=A0A2T7EMR1_9POAL|nr:hypothetical protein GQ55_2G084800 [Panicum hallii var. hallii]